MKTFLILVSLIGEGTGITMHQMDNLDQCKRVAESFNEVATRNTGWLKYRAYCVEG